MTSPTQLSLKKMRDAGYTPFIVEYWHHFSKQRRDLFGFVDILCLKDGEVVGVQATSDDHVSHRVNKIAEHGNVDAVRKAGIGIVVHGWKKVGREWVCREVDCS